MLSANDTLIITSEAGGSTSSPQIQIEEEFDSNTALEKEQARSRINKAALAAATEVGPRVYHLNNSSNDTDEVNFLVFGCHGQGGEEQKAVAELMNRLIAEGKIKKPDYIIITGDNIYPSGASKPDHPNFKHQFDDIYFDPEKLPHLAGIPFFIVAGNHDHNRYLVRQVKEGVKSATKKMTDYVWIPNFIAGQLEPSEIGKEHALNQSAHSYLPNPSDPAAFKTLQYSDPTKAALETIEAKKDLFQQETLETQSLPAWSQPYLYFSTIVGNTQTFYLDSNTYLDDYLDYLQRKANGEDVDPATNQAAWYKAEYDTAVKEGRKVMSVFHHSLQTWGKRAYSSSWDGNLYLAPEKIKRLDLILQLNPEAENFMESVREIFARKPEDLTGFSENVEGENGNYNAMLAQTMFGHQKIAPAVIFSAHDHCMNVSYMPTGIPEHPETCFVCSGGGGSDELQGRKLFSVAEQLAFYIKNQGVIAGSFNKRDPSQIDLHVHSLNNQHLYLTDKKSLGCIQEPASESLHEVRHCVLKACAKYEKFLMKRQKDNEGKFLSRNFTHRAIDVECMDNIVARMKQYENTDLIDEVSFLKDTLKNLSKNTWSASLFNMAKETITRNFKHHYLDDEINKQLKLSPKLNGNLEELYKECLEGEKAALSISQTKAN